MHDVVPDDREVLADVDGGAGGAGELVARVVPAALAEHLRGGGGRVRLRAEFVAAGEEKG